MEFNSLLKTVGNDPVFETSLLFAGKADPANVRLQLARWVTAGRVIRLRRGLYSIAPPYTKTRPHPFLVANRLQPASYVSLQTALAFYGLIPDTVNRVTSVTTGRPEELDTPLGSFEFRHVKPGLLFGYRSMDVSGQAALIALPEKALLDLVYLSPGGESKEYLAGLRLQNLDTLDMSRLDQLAARFGSPKMRVAVKNITLLAKSEEGGYEDL
jgi:predicted transcriptional regulator of viral defense system